MLKTPDILAAEFPELKELFQNEFGKNITSYTPLTAHGSDRTIIRLQDSSGTTAIGIYNENTSENKAFIVFDRYFRENGFNVPEIYRISDDYKFYLMEDLGDTTLLNKIKEIRSNSFSDDLLAYYQRALNVLLKFQIESISGLDLSLCYQFDEFGSENIDYDINYFKERFLFQYYTKNTDQQLLDSELELLKQRIMKHPRDYFLYRDFQSRNIMIKNNELYFIDFQSGRKGALLYDLASLLYDAKANLPHEIRETLITYYLAGLKNYSDFNEHEMRNQFWYFAIIRILQAMGAYGYLGIVKGKKKFLESVPYALKNINYILEHKISNTEFNYLRKVFKELLNEQT